MLNSCAALEIERPERYAKQLAAHIGHKAEVVTEDGTSTVNFGNGAVGTIAVNSHSVLLSASAETEEQMDVAKMVLGKHLLKFAKLEDQTLEWSTN